ncbi:glycosyltransferase BC10-like isoform X1 [Carya illinoinensis]|uniref:glycosyltransferase BC10-like isoform X1 n=2 Tax=Carya illinoinensis TaxID=32201 RepID=UPI001C71DB4A|nr:glycosyltransferase BC10-like isoform X1 [Carya illinoinensis]XP_042991030.1 glycosyltransferase BC10-like isoform X1 [Carya illinoinensis]
MKKVSAWRRSIGDTMSGSRRRLRLMGLILTWTIVLVSLASIFLFGVYIHPPRSSIACSVFSSGGCAVPEQHPSQELSDDQIAARVVLKEILKIPPIQSKNPKIAFMFLASGSLPSEEIWDNFFRGHEGRFSVYVHSSNEKPVHVSPYFEGRDIRSEKVVWGKISMVDAEKRLLANALVDPDNQQFVLLSESILDPGPHGVGRYSECMFPEVKIDDFRKASQWFSLKRQHAVMAISDSFYYRKFSLYCRPNMDGEHCYSDENYLATLFHMLILLAFQIGL